MEIYFNSKNLPRRTGFLTGFILRSSSVKTVQYNVLLSSRIKYKNPSTVWVVPRKVLFSSTFELKQSESKSNVYFIKEKFTHGKLYSMLPGICVNSISLTKSERWALNTGAKLIDKNIVKVSTFILRNTKT